MTGGGLADLPLMGPADRWQGLLSSGGGRRVIWLGAGTGRAALPVAELCDELVCVEESPRLLEVLRERLRALEGTRAKVEVVDARLDAFEATQPGDLVVVPATCVNGIADPARRTEVARAAGRATAPEGRTVLEVLNPYWLARVEPSVSGQVSGGGAPGEVEVVIEDDGFDAWEQRQRATVTYRLPGGGTVTDRIDATALFPRELRALVHQAGLRLEAPRGGDPGRGGPDRQGTTWHLVCHPPR